MAVHIFINEICSGLNPLYVKMVILGLNKKERGNGTLQDEQYLPLKLILGFL